MGERKSFDEEKKVEQQHEGLDPRIWDCGSPLYDAYELVSIANVLDRHLMKFPYVINRSTRSIARPSSYSSTFPVVSQVPVAQIDTCPPRKMRECLFMPSFKLWKMKTNNAGLQTAKIYNYSIAAYEFQLIESFRAGFVFRPDA